MRTDITVQVPEEPTDPVERAAWTLRFRDGEEELGLAVQFIGQARENEEEDDQASELEAAVAILREEIRRLRLAAKRKAEDR